MAGALNNKYLFATLVVLVTAAVFIPFIGNSPLFDWDEVNFAECAREMLVSGNYTKVQLNYQPFWEKPPFFIWLQALSMKLFGVNEFAARFPNALCGIVSMFSLFIIGRRYHSTMFGITWCLLLAASLLPHIYFKSGIIDPWFNLFIFLSLHHAFNLFHNPGGKAGLKSALLAGLFLGLAVLTKGPAAFVIEAVTLLAYLFWCRRLVALKHRQSFLFILTSLLVASSWFAVMWFSGNGFIIREFIDYQLRLFQTGDAGHDGPFYYHIVVLLLGCFPASFFFIMAYFKKREHTPYQLQLRRVMLCLFWAVLIIFSIVKTKIVHYSSLCYYPLTFVAATGIAQYFSTIKPGLGGKILFCTLALLPGLLFTLIGLTDIIKPFIIKHQLINDEQTLLSLNANGNWSGFEPFIGLIYLAASGLLFYGALKQRLAMLFGALGAYIVCLWMAVAVIVPKVERYTQHAVIEFYRDRAGESCYVETHGFKSYAHLFYSERKPGDYINPHQNSYIRETLDLMESEGHSRLSSYSTANLFWMEYGEIDRPAYIVVKTPSEKEVLGCKGFVKLYEKNGFSFLKRLPGNAAK